MKNIIKPILASFMVMVAAIATAQPPMGGDGHMSGKHGGDPEVMAQRMTGKMTSDLGLNADQQAKVKAANLDFVKKMQAIRNDASLDRQGKIDAMKKLGADRNQAMKGVLTAEQYKKMEELQAARAEKMKQDGRKGKAGKQKQSCDQSPATE